MNKTFFQGHDLMLSLFASFGTEKDGFIELPFELSGMTSQSMLFVMNKSLGGDNYRYHKELIRFAFCLLEVSGKLKEAEIIMSKNPKDLGIVLASLNMNNLNYYFHQDNESNQIKDDIINSTKYNCPISDVIREIFLQTELAMTFISLEQNIQKFIELSNKCKGQNPVFFGSSGICFKSSQKRMSIIITDEQPIIDLADNLVKNDNMKASVI